MTTTYALQPGTLYLVATPIGNLQDWSERARSVLGAVDLVLAEDTRVTGLLCQQTGVTVRMKSFHAHNTQSRIPEVLERLRAGESVALTSDRGMPAISDPGQELVDAVWRAGLSLSVIPGPSAVTAAFAASGFPAPFVFWGFLPRRGRLRREAIQAAAAWPHSAVIYEAPHHMQETLEDLAAGLGNREALVGRELTKRHEELWRQGLEQLAAERRDWRGECVLVVGPAKENPGSTEVDWDQLAFRVKQMVTDGMHPTDAIRQVAQDHKVSRRELYQRIHRD